MPTMRYKSVCQYCGKIGQFRFGTSTGGAPNVTPKIAGSCPASPTKQHAPRWEIA